MKCMKSKMGILTEPRTESGKLVKFVTKWEKSMCYFLYIIGIFWLINLANPDVHDCNYLIHNNYFYLKSFLKSGAVI